MSLHTRTASAFAWNHFARTGEYLLSYITSVVLARFLGAQTYGAYAVFLSAVQLLIVVSSYGLEASIVANFPRNEQGGPAAVRPIFRLLLVRGVGIAIVSSGVLAFAFLGVSLVPIPPVLLQYLMILLILFFFRNLISFFGAILISTLTTRWMAIVTVSARILELGGVFVLLSMGKGLTEVFVLITVIAGLQLAAFVPGAGMFHARSAGGRAESSRIIGMGGKFWLSSLMEFILGRQADVVLLGVFLVGRDSIGRYDASLGLAQGINAGMTAGFMGVATASFASLLGRDNAILKGHWEYLARVVIVLVVPLLVFVIVNADVIIPALYSSDFLSGVVFFRIFAVTLVATRMLGGGLAANLLSALGRTDLILRSSLVSGATNLFLAVFLIPLIGPMGAVIATGAGTLMIASMHARFVYSITGVTFPWKFGFGISVVSLVAALSAAAVSSLLPQAGLYGLLPAFLFVFILLLLIVKPFNASDLAHANETSVRMASMVRLFSRPWPEGPGRDRIPVGLTDRQKWAYANVPDGGIVVDVGSSDSTLCRLLDDGSRVAIAVDVDAAALERSRQRDPGAHLMRASGSQLPFRSGSVDTVLCLDVLEHVADENLVVQEIYRILRPGGTFLLSVPHTGMFEFLDPQNMSAWIRGDRDKSRHHRHYSVRSLERILDGKFLIRKIRFGSLFLYPITFGAANFLRKHFRVDASDVLRRIGDRDNDISWGRLSYNLMIHAEKPKR